MNEPARGVRPWSRYIGTAHLKSRYNLTAGISGSYKDVPNAQPTEFGIHRGRPLGRNWLPQVKTFWAGRQDSARDSIRPPCSCRWRHRRGTSLDIRVDLSKRGSELTKQSYATAYIIHRGEWTRDRTQHAHVSEANLHPPAIWSNNRVWVKFDKTVMFKEKCENYIRQRNVINRKIFSIINQDEVENHERSYDFLKYLLYTM